MRFIDTCELRIVGGERIISFSGNDNISLGRLIRLNESAALVYECLEGKDFTSGDVANILCKNYDVAYNDVKNDVIELINQLSANGLIEI